ncbi:acid protease [Penicillium malachiteum]|nr:acid protease [Penicillium malachiteum]
MSLQKRSKKGPNTHSAAGHHKQVAVFGRNYIPPSSTLQKLPGELFEIGHGDEVGVMTQAAWDGDNITSGLVGLAYSAETSAYNSTTSKQHRYNAIFTNMYEHGLVDSYFSLAILHNLSGDAGYLTLGGLPLIKFNHTWTSTNILVTYIKGYPKNWDFYTIHIDDVTANDKTHTKAGGKHRQYMVDSGITLNYYPTSVANSVNYEFDPLAKKNTDGSYYVTYDATSPTHGVTINGDTFKINSLDKILPYGQNNNGKEICITESPMVNVVAVFDVGAVKMRFAPNVEYNSNDTY